MSGDGILIWIRIQVYLRDWIRFRNPEVKPVEGISPKKVLNRLECVQNMYLYSELMSNVEYDDQVH